MKNTKKLPLALFLASLIIGFTGCSNLIIDMENIFLERGYTQEQSETFAQWGRPLRLGEKDAEGNLKMVESYDGKMVYTPDYGSIDVKTKLEKVESLAHDLEKVLNPRNQGAFTKYIDQHNVRYQLTEELAILKTIQAILARITTYEIWLEKLGYPSPMIKAIIKEKRLDNDLLVKFPFFNLEEKTKFEPDYVVNYEKSGPGNYLEAIDMTMEYWIEKDNPDYPEIDRTKTKIDVLQKITLRFLTFDINGDKNLDYLKVFRLDDAGHPEKYPIIALYRDLASSRPNLLIYDIDKPGHPSFGIPDGFKFIYNVKNGSDLYRTQEETIKTVLAGRAEEEKLKFEQKRAPMKSWIVRPGDVIIDNEDINENGHPGPATKYNMGNNFTMVAKKAAPGKSGSPRQDKAIAIEFLALKYHSPTSKYMDIQGRIVEFYKLAPEYADKKFDSVALYAEDKTIEFSENGIFQKVGLNTFIAKYPYQIDFDFGDDRVSIIDDDDDQIYEKKITRKKTSRLDFGDEKFLINEKAKAAYSSDNR